MASQYCFAADHFYSFRKRGCSIAMGDSSSNDTSKKAKRQVTMHSFEKWQRELDCEHHTLDWLPCERNESDHSLVATLWCDVCRKNEDRIRGMRNFSRVWVSGSTYHKTSNIVDHATSDQHSASTARQRVTSAKAQGKPVESYAPIARLLLVMDGRERRRKKQRFAI